MSMQKPASWIYTEDFLTEPPAVEAARRRGEELGCSPVLPGVGAALRLLAASGQAHTVVEIGTGAGAVPGATLVPSAVSTATGNGVQTATTGVPTATGTSITSGSATTATSSGTSGGSAKSTGTSSGIATLPTGNAKHLLSGLAGAGLFLMI